MNDFCFFLDIDIDNRYILSVFNVLSHTQLLVCSTDSSSQMSIAELLILSRFHCFFTPFVTSFQCWSDNKDHIADRLRIICRWLNILSKKLHSKCSKTNIFTFGNSLLMGSIVKPNLVLSACKWKETSCKRRWLTWYLCCKWFRLVVIDSVQHSNQR